MGEEQNYVENPVVQLAFDNIKSIQNSMRRGIDAEQDIGGLLVAIPQSVLEPEKEKIVKLLDELTSEKHRIYGLVPKSVKFQWSRRHLNDWRYSQYRPTRDAIYKQLINIVINRLHLTYLNSDSKNNV